MLSIGFVMCDFDYVIFGRNGKHITFIYLGHQWVPQPTDKPHKCSQEGVSDPPLCIVVITEELTLHLPLDMPKVILVKKNRMSVCLFVLK